MFGFLRRMKATPKTVRYLATECSGVVSGNTPLKILVDFSSPNIAKPFHIGHLRSTLTGKFLVNLLRDFGHDVVGVNFIGDWGMQFAILATGFKHFGCDEVLQRTGIRHLLDVYVQMSSEIEVVQEFRDEVQKFSLLLEHGDLHSRQLYLKLRKVGLQYLSLIYNRLNCHFAETQFESDYFKPAERVFSELEKRHLIHHSTSGLPCIELDGISVPLLRSNYTSLYLTRDIAAALDRYQRHKFDLMMYVTDNGQFVHFENLKSVLQILGCSWSDRIHHIKVGHVQGMSTRQGNVVLVEDVLNQARDVIERSLLENPTTKAKNIHETAEHLAIDAVTQESLGHRRLQNLSFNLRKMLHFKGSRDSGIALQYCHARLCQLEEGSGVGLNTRANLELLVEPQAKELLSAISDDASAQVLNIALHHLESKPINSHLRKLLRLINIALRALPVKSAPQSVAESRLLLFYRARQALAKFMILLCIEPLTKM